MPLDNSLFVSGAVIARDVTMGDGSVHQLWFKELSGVDFRHFQLAEFSEDEDVRARSMARLISASVCEPDGKLAVSYERAQELKPHVQIALVGVIREINKVGKAEKKSSSPDTARSTSGTSSPSASEAAQ